MSNQLPQLKGIKILEIRIYLGILEHGGLAREALAYVLGGAIKEVDPKAPSASYNVHN